MYAPRHAAELAAAAASVGIIVEGFADGGEDEPDPFIPDEIEEI